MKNVFGLKIKVCWLVWETIFFIQNKIYENFVGQIFLIVVFILMAMTIIELFMAMTIIE
jgi:hypothetical protein